MQGCSFPLLPVWDRTSSNSQWDTKQASNAIEQGFWISTLLYIPKARVLFFLWAFIRLPLNPPERQDSYLEGGKNLNKLFCNLRGGRGMPGNHLQTGNIPAHVRQFEWHPSHCIGSLTRCMPGLHPMTQLLSTRL